MISIFNASTFCNKLQVRKINKVAKIPIQISSRISTLRNNKSIILFLAYLNLH